jgi:hypothetical protein
MFRLLREQLKFYDTLLVYQMAPERSDISLAVGSSDLNDDSGSEEEETEEETKEDWFEPVPLAEQRQDIIVRQRTRNRKKSKQKPSIWVGRL